MPTFNGNEYQHATIDLQLSAGGGAGLTLTTFSKMAYKDTVEKKPVLNAQGQIIGYTFDNKKTEGSISLLLSEWWNIKEWAQQQYPLYGIGQIEFDWTLVYGNSVAKLKTDKLYGVMFQEEPRSSESNQEGLMVEIPLFISRIDPHGGAFINYDTLAQQQG